MSRNVWLFWLILSGFGPVAAEGVLKQVRKVGPNHNAYTWIDKRPRPRSVRPAPSVDYAALNPDFAPPWALTPEEGERLSVPPGPNRALDLTARIRTPWPVSASVLYNAGGFYPPFSSAPPFPGSRRCR